MAIIVKAYPDFQQGVSLTLGTQKANKLVTQNFCFI